MDIDIVQTIAIIVTIIAFIISQYFNWKATCATSFNRISDLYDKIAIYRLEHPEILRLGTKWKKGDLKKIEIDIGIARYYSYGELCIGFCENCLYYRNYWMMPKKILDEYYSGLMKLLATENRMLFEDIVEEPYCSSTFREWFESWKNDLDA